VVGLLELVRVGHAEATVEPPVVVPVDPAGGRVLAVGDGLVWAFVEDRGAHTLGLV